MSAEPQVLFLRGVNVGAHRKLPMAELRALLAGLGLDGVRTHIQSGNAVFRDPQHRADLAPRISAAIAAAFPFAPQAQVLPLSALRAVLAANPFATAGARDGARVQIGFLARPSTAATAPLTALAAPDEVFALTAAAFYLHAPGGIGRSLLAGRAERLLGVPMTMRNQRVAEGVAALASEV